MVSMDTLEVILKNKMLLSYKRVGGSGGSGVSGGFSCW